MFRWFTWLIKGINSRASWDNFESIWERDDFCSTYIYALFDTSHDELTEWLPGFFMCYIYKMVVDEEKEKSIWFWGAYSAILIGVKKGWRKDGIAWGSCLHFYDHI
jgi:hypothetical protein